MNLPSSLYVEEISNFGCVRVANLRIKFYALRAILAEQETFLKKYSSNRLSIKYNSSIILIKYFTFLYSLPDELRNLKGENVKTDTFKHKFNKWLSKEPDEALKDRRKEEFRYPVYDRKIYGKYYSYFNMTVTSCLRV